VLTTRDVNVEELARKDELDLLGRELGHEARPPA